MAFFMILMLLVVFSFFAMALDVGVWYFDHRTAQNQADAAATAALIELPSSDTAAAVDAALDWLERNGAARVSNCSAPSGGIVVSGVAFRDRVSPGQYDWVRVCVSRSSPAFFAKLAGIDSVNVSAAAVAAVDRIDGPYSLMALSSTACPAFQVVGQGQVDASGGLTYTGSSCPGALSVQGEATLVADGHDVVGGTIVTPNATLSPAAASTETTGDPFAFLAQPSRGACLSGYAAAVTITNARTLSPGRYCGKLTISSAAQVEFTAGHYVFEQGLLINANSSGRVWSSGDGVILFSTCPSTFCYGAAAANIKIEGQAQIDLHGDPDFENIMLWLDRTSGPPQTNVGNCPNEPPNGRAICVAGGSNLQLYGNIYAPTGEVDIAGGGTAASPGTLNISVVSNVLSFRGNGYLSIPYDAALAPPVFVASLIE